MPMYMNVNGILIKIFVLLFLSSDIHSNLSISVSLPTVDEIESSSKIFTNITTMEKISNESNETLQIVNDDAITEEIKYFDQKKGRSFQDANNNNYYSVYEYDQNYDQQDNYNYKDIQTTSSSTIGPFLFPPSAKTTFSTTLTPFLYPLLTTSKPKLYHAVQKSHPHTLKVHIRPVQKMSNGVLRPEEHSSEEFFDSEIVSDFIPLASLYSTGTLQKWMALPPYQSTQFVNPNQIYNTFEANLEELVPYRQNILEFSNPTLPETETIQETMTHHVPVIAEIQSKPAKPKLDLKKLGILALVKIGLTKLKAFGILKILFFLLLKFKLFLLAIFIKFLLFLKALKLLKTLLLPFLLLSLLPLLLLLLPLLFLPLLLPLLLLLPVPVVSPVAKRIEILDYIKTQKSDPLTEIISHVLDSEHCIERIACQLATKKESKLLYPIVDWYLNKLSSVIHNEKIISYIEAYLKSVREYNGDYTNLDGDKWCSNNFQCTQSEPTDEKDRKEE